MQLPLPTRQPIKMLLHHEGKQEKECMSALYADFFVSYILRLLGLALSNVFLIDDDLLIKLNESESLQFTVMAVQSIFETDF